MNFDWQTGEEEPQPQKNGEIGARNRRPWLLAGLMVLLVVLAYVGWQALQDYLLARETAVKADVFSSHQLIRQAASTGDVELFHALLSGRDADWTEAQQVRVERGLLLSPIPASVLLHPVFEAPEMVTISLNSKHREAILLVDQPYVAVDAQGLTETVVLQQTYVYHRGAQRWLLSPPDPSFWGPQDQVRGELIMLDYPRRDEEIARRLAVDLDAKLQEMCQLLAPSRSLAPFSPVLAGCPANLHVQLRLSSHPDSLISLINTELWLQSGPELVLPTPTLVGLPTTEAAYQALFREYAARVLSNTLVDLTGYTCCAYRVVLDKQLHQLGVLPEPLTTANALSLFQNFAPLHKLEPVWRLTPPNELTEAERLLLYAFVDLVVEERGWRLADLLTWPPDLVVMVFGTRELAEESWWQYIYERAAQAPVSAAPTPPYPWPAQELYLTCQDEEGEAGLYRYDPAADVWTVVRVFGQEAAALLPLPDDSGLVISVGQTEKEVFVWQPDGTVYPIPVETGNVSLLPGVTADPVGRYLLLQYSAPNVSRPVYLDIDSCTGDGCALMPALAGPVWSPDGSQLLLWSNGRLRRGQALISVLTPVAPAGARSPFWQSTNVPGYVTRFGDRIMVVPGDGEQAEVWLTVDDLAAVVPPENEPGSWQIELVRVTPHETSFLVIANRRDEPGYHFFLVRKEEASADQAAGEWAPPAISYLLNLPQLPDNLHFSPDGRWLAIPIFEQDFPASRQFILYNLRGPEPTLQSQLPFPTTTHTLDWPADSRWLAHLGTGFLAFIAPDNNNEPYRRYVFYDELTCSSLAWLE